MENEQTDPAAQALFAALDQVLKPFRDEIQRLASALDVVNQHTLALKQFAAAVICTHPDPEALKGFFLGNARFADDEMPDSIHGEQPAWDELVAYLTAVMHEEGRRRPPG